MASNTSVHNHTRRLLSRPRVAFLSLALAALLMLPPASSRLTGVDSNGCVLSPFSGIPEAERWRMINPCVTLSGIVETADFPSSGGAYWIMLRLDATSMAAVPGLQTFGEPLLWAKFYPNQFPDVPRPRDKDQVTLKGSLVYDTVYGWQELVPVWSVDGPGIAAPANPVRLRIEGMIVGDIVTYSVVAWNDGHTRLGPVYIAARNPAGGIAEWLVPSIESGTYAGPFIYTSERRGDLGVHAFAHWLSPLEGSVTTPTVQPQVR